MIALRLIDLYVHMGRNRHILFAFVLGMAMAVAGCATRPTGYVEAGYNNGEVGYTVTALDDDDYGIVVRGNPATWPQRAAAVAMLRAARLTLEKGAEHFTVIHSGLIGYEHQDPIMIPIAGGVAVPIGARTLSDVVAVMVIHVQMPGTNPTGTVFDARSVELELSKTLQP